MESRSQLSELVAMLLLLLLLNLFFFFFFFLWYQHIYHHNLLSNAFQQSMSTYIPIVVFYQVHFNTFLSSHFFIIQTENFYLFNIANTSFQMVFVLTQFQTYKNSTTNKTQLQLINATTFLFIQQILLLKSLLPHNLRLNPTKDCNYIQTYIQVENINFNQQCIYLINQTHSLYRPQPYNLKISSEDITKFQYNLVNHKQILRLTLK
eukprot:TRINITY_DN46855_c0_g1_i3.p1 TRINITY_DN46855_c0_g1~~TRINITY_DN46855_c0_g1_i3.p1  ORF type:complete len:207 (+),score=-32.42 TRINITY_DN46855_c0_g1_i3:371-991(+)